MQKTRLGTEQKREKERLKKQWYRARLSPEKHASVTARDRELAKKRRKLIGELLLNKSAQAAALSAKGRRQIEENRRRCEEQEEKEKYELQFEEEPDVIDEDVLNVRLAYEFARRYPVRFENATGETPESFDALFQVLEGPLSQRTYKGGLRQRAAPRPPRVSDQHQLFICLLFLRQYPTYNLLILFLRGLEELTLHHYIFRVLVALESLAELQIKWPSDAEFNELLKKQQSWPFPWLCKVVCAIDGTEIRVGRPSTNAMKNPHYSAKKKQYALNVLVVVRLDGVIIYCSDPTAKMNDQGLFKASGLRSRFIGKPYGICADGGFTLNYVDEPEATKIIGVTPHKRPRASKKKGVARGRLSDEQKRCNAELSKTRVVVENTNRRLKNYKVIGAKLRHYRAGGSGVIKSGITPALIMRVVAGLTNRSIERLPLRKIDWQPQLVRDEDLLSCEGSDGEEECEEGDEESGVAEGDE